MKLWIVALKYVAHYSAQHDRSSISKSIPKQAFAYRRILVKLYFSLDWEIVRYAANRVSLATWR